MIGPNAGFARPLLISTMRWFSSARLAQTLVDHGFAVSALAPSGHPVAAVTGMQETFALDQWSPEASFKRAIEEFAPDILLADDERTLILLRRMYERYRGNTPAIAALIEHSLGAVEHWPTLMSRSGFAHQAKMLGIHVPRTDLVLDLSHLQSWAAEHGSHLLLKTDASSGGRGVRLVEREEDLAAAYQRSVTPVSFLVALRRMIVQRDAGALRNWTEAKPPAVNVQQYIDGKLAVATACAHHGDVVGFVAMEVLQVMFPRGPAAVVKLIDPAPMQDVAQRLASHFGLTGFFGMDFIIGRDGEPYLIELNERITPTCHLMFDPTRSPGQEIGLFPQEPIRDSHSPYCRPELLDVPRANDALVAAGWREQRKQRLLMSAVNLNLKLGRR